MSKRSLDSQEKDVLPLKKRLKCNGALDNLLINNKEIPDLDVKREFETMLPWKISALNCNNTDIREVMIFFAVYLPDILCCILQTGKFVKIHSHL